MKRISQALLLVLFFSASCRAEVINLMQHPSSTAAHGATGAVVGTTNSQTVTNKTMSTGCSWGGTAVPVANGGTGATTAANARTAFGLGNVATLNIGTTGGTAAAGDDSRMSDSRKCNNTFDTAATARTNLGLGTAATTAATDYCAAGDSRLTNSRACNNSFDNAATSRSNLGVAYGTTAGTVGQGNDSRFSDSRKCNNTFDDAATSRSNLGLGTAATTAATSYAPAGGSTSTDWSAKNVVIADGLSAGLISSVDPTDRIATYFSKWYFNVNGLNQFTIHETYVSATCLQGTGNRLVYSESGGILTNSSSDARLKKNIATLTSSLEKVLSLRGVSYNWNTDVAEASRLGSQNEIGLIAQEVEPIVPEVVGTNGNGMKSVDYPKLVALLIESTKEQQAQISSLKARIETLEAK